MNQIDFPLNISLSLANPDNIARLLVFSVSENGDSTNLIADLNNLNGSSYEAIWSNKPEKGVYKIYSELRMWNGEILKSNEVVVTIS